MENTEIQKIINDRKEKQPISNESFKYFTKFNAINPMNSFLENTIYQN